MVQDFLFPYSPIGDPSFSSAVLCFIKLILLQNPRPVNVPVNTKSQQHNYTFFLSISKTAEDVIIRPSSGKKKSRKNNRIIWIQALKELHATNHIKQQQCANQCAFLKSFDYLKAFVLYQIVGPSSHLHGCNSSNRRTTTSSWPTKSNQQVPLSLQLN